MGVIGNVLWFVLGGVFMGLGWWLVGALAFISIIGIPWGRACFVIGGFAFFPFGREAVNRKDLTRQGDIGTGSSARSATSSGSSWRACGWPLAT